MAKQSIKSDTVPTIVLSYSVKYNNHKQNNSALTGTERHTSNNSTPPPHIIALCTK